MRKNLRKLTLNRQVVRQLGTHLSLAAGGMMNDSIDEKSCNPCGDWPTSPYVGCTLAVKKPA